MSIENTLEMNNIFCIIFITILSVSCQKAASEKLNATNYVTWMHNKDHGYYQQKTIGNINFSLFRQTSDYRRVKFDQEKAGEQFVLRMSPVDKNSGNLLEQFVNSTEAYFELRDYFNSEFKNQIKLRRQDATEEAPMAYMYIPNYRTASYIEFVFAFDEVPQEELFYIALQDEVFGSGPIQFLFKNSLQPKLIANAK